MRAPNEDGGADVTDKIEHGTPAFLRTNLALFCAGLATLALLYCVQPLLPVFAAEFGVGAAGASLSLSLSTGLLAAALPVAGGVSEVWGRKPVMLASLLCSAALAMACAAIPHWPTLLLLRALMGITLSGLPAVAMAYVGEEMHPRSVGLAMGLYVGGNGLGGMAGRLLTGVATDLAGWRAAMLTIGGLGFLCAAVLWRALPPSRHFTPRAQGGAGRAGPVLRTYGLHLRDPGLLMLFAEGGLMMGAFVTVYNYVGFRLLAPPFSLSQTAVGVIFAVYLFGVVSSACVGAVAGRIGRARVLPVTVGLMLAGIGLTLSGRLVPIVLGIAVLTVGFFGGHSIASATVGARAAQGKAQASSLYLFSYYAGSSLVGTLGGLCWNAAGWPGVAAMTGGLVVLAFLIAIRLARLPDRRLPS